MGDLTDLRFRLRNASRTALLAVAMSFIVATANCTGLAATAAATENTLYLSPIPQATLAAYRRESPIETKLQAVIAARVYLGATRLRFADEPRVVSVIEESPQVWRVVLEGEWQAIPPDPRHIITPSPPTHGCVLVLVDKESVPLRVSTIACP